MHTFAGKAAASADKVRGGYYTPSSVARFLARWVRAQIYRDRGDLKKADAEFRTLLLFAPASREVWEQWYEGQKRAGPGAPGPASESNP